MAEEGKPLAISQAAQSPTELGERVAIRVMLAGIISYQAATSAHENMKAAAIVAEMKRIMWTVIQAMDLQVKNDGNADEALVIEETIRQLALQYLDETFAFVKI